MLTNDIVSFEQLVPGPEVREADTFKSVTKTPGSLSFYLKVIYRHWVGGGGGGGGGCKGVVYLMSPGCPRDIDLQLGKACYPCSL